MPRHIGCGSLKQNRAAFSRRAILRFPISITTKKKSIVDLCAGILRPGCPLPTHVGEHISLRIPVVPISVTLL